MNILVSFNDKYVFPTKVMLKSLIMNNKKSALSIYVIYENLTEGSIQSIRELEAPKVQFVFIQISYDDFNFFPITKHFSKDSYVRLFAQKYLDESLDRILWLDGDMIVNKSIENFYHQDFEGKCYIAVEDIALGRSVKKHKELDMPTGTLYVNTGVLLINLKKVRKTISHSRIADYVRRNEGKIQYVDQDVFNGLLHQYFKVADTGFLFNYLTYCISFKNEKKILEMASIIHYASPYKPWKRNYRYAGYDLWWKYALMLGDEYKKLYRRNYLSCLRGRMEHGVALIMQDKIPSIYDVALRAYMKKRGGVNFQ